MLDSGTSATFTAVARTVAFPAAIGVKMKLNDKIKARGVHISVFPEIYNPILNRLVIPDIKMTEEYGLRERSVIKLEKKYNSDIQDIK